jgi:hypothetical protein
VLLLLLLLLGAPAVLRLPRGKRSAQHKISSFYVFCCDDGLRSRNYPPGTVSASIHLALMPSPSLYQL